MAAVVVFPEPWRPTSIRTDGLRVEAEPMPLPAEHRDELVVDDLDDLLAGVDPVEHVGAERALADVARRSP